MSVTVKALKTIRKKGSLDNYLLSFSSVQMRSQLGDKLKELIVKKLKDPTMKVPYVPKTFGKLVTPAERRKKQ